MLLLLLACTDNAVVDDTATAEGCGSLSLRPAEATVLPLGLVQFTADALVGEALFTVDGEGEINPSSGAFRAGSQPAVVTVQVADQACPQTRSATVTVVQPMDMQPRAVALAPGDTVDFDLSGGSGQFDCDCRFTASDEGVFAVRATDTVTGEFVDARVEVAEGNALNVPGYEGLYIPVGAHWQANPVTGSGFVSLQVTGPFSVEDDTVTAEEVGSGALTLTDDYTGASLTIPVHGIAPIAPDAPRDGERSGGGQAVSLGDLDGDGQPEVALGLAELSFGAHQSGGVIVYASSGEVLQVIGGHTRFEASGRALWAEDADGDGRIDLLVGAYGGDSGSTNNGTVSIHHGLGGGLFEDEASRVLDGDAEYDRFGSAIVTCDFDDDGFLDLAVGARDAEDLSSESVLDEAGAVHIYRGGETGWSDTADFVLYGTQDGGGLGDALAAGDFDGDGLCDLAAAAVDDGEVLLFAGTLTDGLTLAREAVNVLEGGDDFGRRMAAGDVDGDGADELLVGDWKAEERSEDGGAAWIFVGALTAAEPAWQIHGLGQDRVGSDVDLRDLDGDGRAEVLIGAYRDEDGEVSQGLVRVFYEVSLDDQDYTGETPDFTAVGPQRDARLGQVVLGLPDRTGDGVGEVFSLAGYDGSYGVDVGAPYVATSDQDLQRLELPGEAAGHRWGGSVATVGGETYVGGPGVGFDGEGSNAGVVVRLSDEGVVFGTHDTYSTNDAFGYALAGGDLDGDGRQDLAIVGRKDSRPSSSACGGYEALAGTVVVHRGNSAGLSAQPRWWWHNEEAYAYVDRIVSGFDHDGDGRDDLLVAGSGWSGDDGGFSLIYGQSATGELCSGEYYGALDRFDRMGWAIDALGDVDGDGCDEVVVGSTGEETHGDYSNQGTVRVLWGWGPGCASTAPEMTLLTRRVVGSGLGSAFAVGDVDGDGVVDLVVGGSEHREDFAEVGGVWLVPGSYLRTLPRQGFQPGELPAIEDSDWSFLTPPDGLETAYGLHGDEAAGLFGEALAVLPDGSVAVGVPQGKLGGTSWAGGVVVYGFDGGFASVPHVVVVGETHAPHGQLGWMLRAEEGVLWVGAPESDVAGVDFGALYRVEIEGSP